MNRFEGGLRKLLVAQLSELLFCEHQLTLALEVMAQAAHHDALKAVFHTHKVETEGHVERLGECFAELKEIPRQLPCRATEGLVEDMSRLIDVMGADPVFDHALVAAAQRVEMFEISSYRTVVKLASSIGQCKIAEIARDILHEEERANEELTQALTSPGRTKGKVHVRGS